MILKLNQILKMRQFYNLRNKSYAFLKLLLEFCCIKADKVEVHSLKAELSPYRKITNMPVRQALKLINESSYPIFRFSREHNDYECFCRFDHGSEDLFIYAFLSKEAGEEIVRHHCLELEK